MSDVPSGSSASRLGAARRTTLVRADVVAVVVVLLIALAARIWRLWDIARGTLVSSYDPATYYLGGAALLHGRVPYRGDYTLLHPPVIVLLGALFALVGHLTTAHIGFVLACLGAGAMGAVGAAGVVVVGRQWGLPRGAAVAGGLLVAVWSTVVTAQARFRLEPIGDLLLVLLLVALGRPAPRSRARLVVAGVVLGLLVDVKVWWFVPVLVVLVIRALQGPERRVFLVPLCSAALTAVVLDLPFLVLSHGRMFRDVVLTQLGRGDTQGTPAGLEHISAAHRLDQMTGVSALLGRFLGPDRAYTDPRVHLLTATVVLVIAAFAVLAVRTPLGRLAVPLLAAQVLVLLLSPLYFDFYGDFVGVSSGLVLAAGAAALPRLGAWAHAVPAAFLVGLVLSYAGTAPDPSRVPDLALLRGALRGAGCVVSDLPGALIELDAVDASLSPGCRNVVDFQGVGHGGGPDPRAVLDGLAPTPRWRSFMVRYLRSSDRLVLGNPINRQLLGPVALREVLHGRWHLSSGGVTVYGPPAAAGRQAPGRRPGVTSDPSPVR